MTKSKPHILVVDDEKKLLESFIDILKRNGYGATGVSTGNEAIETVNSMAIDLVFLDYELPDCVGTDILEKIWDANSLLPIVMMSAYSTIPRAVKATRAGVLDFLEKANLDAKRILDTAEKYLHQRFSETENYELSEEYFSAFGMIGTSAAMRQLYDKINKVAPTDASVLIQGESGTGKELVAAALHKLGNRSSGAFIKVNCASIPHELIENELFGHEKGAYTHAHTRQRGKFTLADKGTIFLDEIGDMEMATQAKVLRVLQDGEVTPVGCEKSFRVDARVIAATNKNLKDRIKNGLFRKDLLYRLNVVTLDIPPLRERKEDIPLLLDFFLQKYCDNYNRKLKRLSARVKEILIGLDWADSNVRELENFIEKLVILVDADLVELPQLQSIFDLKSLEENVKSGLTLKESRELYEKELIRNRLLAYDWNVATTATTLGIERTNLHRKMSQYGLKRPLNNQSSKSNAHSREDDIAK